MKTRAAVLALTAVSCMTAVWLVAQEPEAFPHRQHDRLFPLCESCHEGIALGDRVTSFPEPAQCAACHDGEREERVSWSGPQPRLSNLLFAHTDHADAVRAEGDSTTCASCHDAGTGGRMAVRGPDPADCMRCHAHEARDHLEKGRDCQVCHAPLVATALPAQRLAGFARPPGHDAPDFLLDHAPASDIEQGACATCHARESCTRCHLDASLSAIAALGQDPRIAEVWGELAPEYPEPASHAASRWAWLHAADAQAGAASCGNCHARSSCTACHRELSVAEIAALPDPAPEDARGVRLDVASVRVHREGYVRAHAPEAAVMGSTCEACHASSTCEGCHAAAAAPAYHGLNFMARHGPDAYANDTDCASCHNAEVFCRACHSGGGLASSGRLGVAFHTANPLWIVGHGAAARRGLEGCAACHAQSDCTQCHSTLGGWRISPHGPAFDPDRLEQANPLLCRRCHRAADVVR